uniref:Uncharacterized protein n=1 Tax=Romanomermis culicivorax TaxID=13658 RepID=A0A915KN12_ROMCU
MNEMIENYLKAARQRFDAERNPNFLPFLNQLAETTTATASNATVIKSDNSAELSNNVVDGPSNNSTGVSRVSNNGGLLGSRRERLSRSFSATSVVVKCMNGNCDGQGSHQTNFLCDLCFKTQKRLMESFSASTMASSPPRFDQSLLDRNLMTDDMKAKIYAIDDDEDELLIKPATAPADNPYAVARSTFYASLAQTRNLPCSPAKQYKFSESQSYTIDLDIVAVGNLSYPDAPPPSVTIVQPLRSSIAPTNAKSTPMMTSAPRRPSAAVDAAPQISASPLQRSVYRTIETSYNVVNQVDSPQGSSICYYAPPIASIAADYGDNDADEPCCNLQCRAYDARCYSLCPKCIDRRRLEEKTNLEISNRPFIANLASGSSGKSKTPISYKKDVNYAEFMTPCIAVKETSNCTHLYST